MKKGKSKIAKAQIYKLTDDGEKLVSETDRTKKETPKTSVYNLMTAQAEHEKRMRDICKIAIPNTGLKNVLQSIGETPIHKVFKDIEAYNNPMRRAMESYNKTFADVFNRVSIFQQNPTTQLRESIEKSINEFRESEARVKNEIAYQLVETESNEQKTELKKARSLLETKDEKIKQLEKLIFQQANFIVGNQNPKPASTKSKPKTLTLKSELNYAQKATIYQQTQSLFKSDFEQWINLFGDRIKTPVGIELKPNTTNRTLALLFQKLYESDYGYIGTNEYASILEKCKAFKKKGKYITAKSISRGKHFKTEFRYKANNEKVLQLVSELNETLPEAK